MREDKTEYVLDNAWVEARRRLTLLEEVFDPGTARAFDGLGVDAGWSCLEVGAGGGSVTRLLCSRVGPSGRVTAVDIDTRFLDNLPEKNLEVVCRDIVADGVPGGPYDLIHTRMLLMHLPARDKLLKELVSALRPGGWLLAEELDSFPVTQLADGLYGTTTRHLLDAFERVGMAWTWARDLPLLFSRVGLDDVTPMCDVKLFSGGSTYAEVLALSLTQVRPLVLAAGATEAELDEVAQLLTDPRQWFPGWAMVSVAGRASER